MVRQQRPARTRGLTLAAVAVTAGGLGTGLAVATPEGASAQAGGATMAVKKEDRRVRYRERIAVRGQVGSAQPGRPVTIEYAPLGGDYRPVRRTTSGEAGRYAAGIRLRETGSIRAVVDGSASAPARVAVAATARSKARRHLRAGRIAVVRGALKPGRSGRRVYVQVSEGRGWDTVDRARTRRGGAFKARFRMKRPGAYRVRVVFRGDRRNAGAARRLRGGINVYRAGHASWYGPGFYGRRTACGQTLGTGTLGVAHKRLPCGTDVTFRYRGRTVTVPVIDRGPFIAGREWDLTGATKRKLGFGSTGTVWSTR